MVISMEKKVYITEEERTKCQKVADAFAELYKMADSSMKQGKALSMTGVFLLSKKI